MSPKALLLIALLTCPTTASATDVSVCGQLQNLSATRLRWDTLRKSRVEHAKAEISCRSFGANFVEAVTVRQVALACSEGINRQRLLELLDSEIDAFNELIATRCSG
jgi:hypothetical protein